MTRLSPARAHFQKKMAEKQAVEAKQSDTPIENQSQNELMQAQLLTHQRQLSQIQSMQKRAELKAEILPEYEAYVEGVLAADAGVQDDVLMRVMIWRIDVKDFAGALAIGEYAIKHSLAMPEGFKRGVASSLAEEFANIFIKMDDEQKSAQDEYLIRVHELTSESDMHDEIQAKLHKALGLALQESDVEAAIEHLEKAVELDEKIGVKKVLQNLRKQ